MPAAIVRLFVAAAAAISLASVPIYPGAAPDVAGMKELRVRDPKNTDKVFLTPDGYEAVVAFYKRQRGASQFEAISIGNTARQKMGMFSFGDSSVALNWPVNVVDKSGKITSRAGTRIAIGN